MKKPLSALALALSATALAPSASAIEIYASNPGPVVIRSPRVYVPTTRVIVSEPLVYAPPPVTHVRVAVQTPAAAEPSDDPQHPQPQEQRDPRSSVFIGAGYGGLMGFDGRAAPSWRLHLGLGLGATEFGLRADIASRALDDLGTTAGSAYLITAEVAHRFMEGATVRPVIGAGFDRWQIDPDTGNGAGAFGVGVRAGVEIHYRVGPGAALVFGADLGYHRMFATIDGANISPDVMTFGATADIRL